MEYLVALQQAHLESLVEKQEKWYETFFHELIF